ncbi:helix-turn-helix transcriptional regulator [Secundilactobacillus kimchicus]|uniref:helix-turn-helix transcriptional regulator n=1 Tax=Secundilactobacillus kimchicus TaxID=528209 RepID=UPI0024A7C1B5|nr:helix-turn-helix transcriptional regulator [Secundilactobacillus kimchicus]
MNLREARLSRGESQQELATAVRVSISTIQKFEQGRREMSDKLKIKIADHLGYTVGYIFFGDEITESNRKEVSQ